MTPKLFAYYFPNWHQDPRNDEWFTPGWNEWDLLKDATPRYPDHRQPRTPLLGEFDESDPQVMDTQIELATRYGIDGFLFDYYWYQDGPFLQKALDEGFLKASRRQDLGFALMWANHALVNIFPSHNLDGSGPLLAAGDIGRGPFEDMARHVTDAYFSQPNYYLVENRPFLSIYDLETLVLGLGGIPQTLDALHWFGSLARTKGFAGIHLDGVVRGENELPGSTTFSDPVALLSELGFDSATSYVWIHHAPANEIGFPAADWDKVRRLAFESYERIAASSAIPFHPNVTVGWDSTPRTDQTMRFDAGEYPWIPAADPTPEQFAEAISGALDFVERHQAPHPLVTINAWNEWTEGSYLLPDTVRRYGYLDALRNALDDKKARAQ